MISDRKKAAIHSLGCKVNSYESQAMEESLKKDGYEIVDFSDIADVYVINTCTVTATADKKSRQMIRRARNKNPEAIVVACGCFVEKDIKPVWEDCDILIGNEGKSGLIEKIREYSNRAPKEFIKSNIFEKDSAFENLYLSRPQEKTRAFVKIQDGCNAFCTYCIIPYVRGRSRSRTLSDIVDEVSRLTENSPLEIVLTGINLSDYHSEQKSLQDVILAINDISGVSRIRLGSLEPDVFTPEFVDAIAGAKKLCPHFHFSLQSACDKTLKNMGRRYSVSDFISATTLLREHFDNPALCADVIAGFTGETEEDFRESYENIKSAGLFELHVFPYSEREGTKALGFAGKVPKKIRTERASNLIKLGEESAKRYRASLSGKKLKVLFEEIDEDGYWIGFSEEYVRVRVKSSEDLRGKIRTLDFSLLSKI